MRPYRKKEIRKQKAVALHLSIAKCREPTCIHQSKDLNQIRFYKTGMWSQAPTHRKLQPSQASQKPTKKSSPRWLCLYLWKRLPGNSWWNSIWHRASRRSLQTTSLKIVCCSKSTKGRKVSPSHCTRRKLCRRRMKILWLTSILWRRKSNKRIPFLTKIRTNSWRNYSNRCTIWRRSRNMTQPA